MLSISNRAAVCLAGFALSGCMQSMPTAEAITKPTMEAFTRLSAWQPWRQAPASAPQTAVAVAPLELPGAISAAEPKQKHAIERPHLDRARAPAKPHVSAPTAPAVVPVTTEAVVVPAKVTCHTSTIAGERVRMECIPVQAIQ
jgi:hypothetical protein